jgi:hypothetical protein
MLRNRFLVGSVLAGAGLLGGCGAAVDEEEAGRLDESSAALTGAQICELIDELASLSLGDTGTGVSATVDASCASKGGSQLSYLGGVAPAKFAKGVSRVEAQTLFCALKGADDATASATSTTGVGKFGVSSKVNVYKSDSTALTLSGQRVATIYAFGVGMPIDNQTFSWSFPSEKQQAQVVAVEQPWPPLGTLTTIDSLPEQTGQYAKAKSNGYGWGIDGNVKFPLGPVTAELNVNFHNGFLFQTGATRAYYMDDINGSFDTKRLSSYSDYVKACNACKAAGSSAPIPIPCDCPTSDEIRQHFRVCGSDGCTQGFFADLEDGRLPHENLRGAAGPFWDSGSRDIADFWHYGRPGSGASSTAPGSAIAEGEPVYSIADDGKNATTALDLSLGFKYDAGPADVGLTVHMDTDFRSGVALREYRQPFADVAAMQRVTEVGLDAQSAFGVDARLVVNVDVPFVGGKKVLDARFEIISRRSKQSSTKLPSKVLWDDLSTGQGKINSYSANGVSASIETCLEAPAVNESAIQAETPQSFVEDLRDEIPNQLFPCNITVCAADSAGATPRKRSCSWNATTRKVVCSAPTTPCACLDTHADLCDAAGNVYKAKSEGTEGCVEPIR